MTDWIAKNAYLSETEMQVNAELVRDTMNAWGWSLEAICGMLGNMETESTINPGIWQDLTVGTGGYGLVQWTPARNYLNWANAHSYSITDGYYQCLWMKEMTVPTTQWIPTSRYNISWNSFVTSKQSPGYLARAFLYNFERPGDPGATENQRAADAEKWYKFLSGEEPGPDPGPGPGPTPGPVGKGTKLKFMYYPRFF